MQSELYSVLIDLSSRFLLTLSQEDFENFERLFFAVEEAHWFYDDFFREKNASLPKLTLKEFTAKLFEHSPLLKKYTQHVEHLLRNFQQYKNSIPTAGVALLNSTLDKVLLVRSFRGKSWSFPKGKVGKDESYETCAVREAKEEVGFDVSEQLNRDNLLTSNWQGHESFIFIVPGIPDATKFETTTRKEISEIKWHDIFTLPSSEEDFSGIHSLPNSKRSRYFSVLPFVKPLQRWVLSRRKTLGEIPKMLDVEHPRTTVYSSNATSKRGNRREAPSKQRVEAKSMKRNTKDVETFGMGKPFSSREEERQFFQACLDRNSNNTDIQPKVHSFPQDKDKTLKNSGIKSHWEVLEIGLWPRYFAPSSNLILLATQVGRKQIDVVSMENSSVDSFEINSSTTDSSTSSKTFSGSFSSTIERGREILTFLKYSHTKNSDINSESDVCETSNSSEGGKAYIVSPDISVYQKKSKWGEMRTQPTRLARFGVMDENSCQQEQFESRIEENEVMMENYRTKLEIHSAREQNAMQSKKLEHLTEKLHVLKSEKKTYLHRIEILKQEVSYLKNELQDYHSRSKMAHEREYETQSQLRGYQRKHEQLLKENTELKENVATLKQKLEMKENLYLETKEKEEKYFELEETWKLERDSLIRAYEELLLKQEQLEKSHERLLSKAQNDQEQFNTVEKILRQRIEELECKEKVKEEEMENLRKKYDLACDDLEQLKRELALNTESIRNYETQLICTEEALRFSKESSSHLEHQLQDWLHRREVLENRLEERERQCGTLYSENIDLRRTVNDYQVKLLGQQTEIEFYKERTTQAEISNYNDRVDFIQQTDESEHLYENGLDSLFSRISALFVDTVSQLQLSNEVNAHSANKRGRWSAVGESTAVNNSVLKDIVHFSVENLQVSCLPGNNETRNAITGIPSDKPLDNADSLDFSAEEVKYRTSEVQVSRIDEWKHKLMEWKFLIDAKMKEDFLCFVEGQDIVMRIDRLSEELFHLIASLDKCQNSSLPHSIDISTAPKKSILRPDQENIVLGAILTHICQLRNLWLHEVEVNHLLRNMLLSMSTSVRNFSGKHCEFPPLSQEHEGLLDRGVDLYQDMIE